MTLVSVSITGPDADWLADHARSLVEAELVACGNIIPAIRSIYRWEGNVEDDAEAYVVLHTRREHVPAIIEHTNAAHPLRHRPDPRHRNRRGRSRLPAMGHRVDPARRVVGRRPATEGDPMSREVVVAERSTGA